MVWLLWLKVMFVRLIHIFCRYLQIDVVSHSVDTSPLFTYCVDGCLCRGGRWEVPSRFGAFPDKAAMGILALVLG